MKQWLSSELAHVQSRESALLNKPTFVAEDKYRFPIILETLVMASDLGAPTITFLTLGNLMQLHAALLVSSLSIMKRPWFPMIPAANTYSRFLFLFYLLWNESADKMTVLTMLEITNRIQNQRLRNPLYIKYCDWFQGNTTRRPHLPKMRHFFAIGKHRKSLFSQVCLTTS